MPTLDSNSGYVLDVSRRHVTLLSAGRTVSGSIASRALDVVTGDLVKFESRDGKVFVTDVFPSHRTLSRSYRGTLKRMGANIDLLCVITAVGATLNPAVIDRMLIAAQIQKIPVVLVVNKADLGIDLCQVVLNEYRKIGIPVEECSAKYDRDFSTIKEIIQRESHRVVALCGVSGVGKSTILNRLIPGAAAKTGELSHKTGQGRQTTSQPRGFLYSSADGSQRIVIDFPGVGFFGLSHVEKDSLPGAFQEFNRFSPSCRFLNCRHLQEPECGVRDAVERGDIAPWRYNSYLQILQEIEDAREY